MKIQSQVGAETPPTEALAMASARLMRLDKPIGIYLLLWPTLSAVLLASGGSPALEVWVIFIAGVVLTRSAGCVINDYADRWLDGSVSRTKSRPLATGALSGRFALALFAALMFAAFLLVLRLNWHTIIWAFFAAAVASIYPFVKRVSHYPQLVLGVAFSLGIPMAYSAHGLVPDSVCWLLFGANVLWTIAYDTLYAMVDREDDLRAGAKSSAILLGRWDLFSVSTLYTTVVSTLLVLGWNAKLGTSYFIALLLIAMQFVVQLLHAHKRTPAACFASFKANQWVGLTLFFGVLLGLLEH